jgi:hypothetical protein
MSSTRGRRSRSQGQRSQICEGKFSVWVRQSSGCILCSYCSPRRNETRIQYHNRMLLSARNVPPKGTIRDSDIILTRDHRRHAAQVAVEIDRKNGQNCRENLEYGEGLGRGRGSDRGPITGAMGPIRRSGSRPRPLVSTSYAFPVSCHSRGRSSSLVVPAAESKELKLEWHPTDNPQSGPIHKSPH